MATDPLEDIYNGEPEPDDDMIDCPGCERSFEARDAGRVGGEWLCPECYQAHPVVVGEVMAALVQDDAECPF